MDANEREAIPKEKPEPQMNSPAVKRVCRSAYRCVGDLRREAAGKTLVRRLPDESAALGIGKKSDKR
jgi:hypothetical protein